jgi:hypothetical protein
LKYRPAERAAFTKKYFFITHVRISLDLLNTRNKEKLFMQLGITLEQRMVVDNTNVTKKERAMYISNAKMDRFKVCAYFLETILPGTGKDKIKKVGIIAKLKALEVPLLEEGCYITILKQKRDEQKGKEVFILLSFGDQGFY